MTGGEGAGVEGLNLRGHLLRALPWWELQEAMVEGEGVGGRWPACQCPTLPVSLIPESAEDRDSLPEMVPTVPSAPGRHSLWPGMPVALETPAVLPLPKLRLLPEPGLGQPQGTGLALFSPCDPQPAPQRLRAGEPHPPLLRGSGWLLSPQPHFQAHTFPKTWAHFYTQIINGLERPALIRTLVGSCPNCKSRVNCVQRHHA